MEILDWDLEGFTDSQFKYYYEEKYGSKSVNEENPYYIDDEDNPYIAILYRQGESLFCGVTYELERSFKWVKNFTDAQSDGKAALKISSTGEKK
jgi:hypothetical protein